jgi:hypothetical protein
MCENVVGSNENLVDAAPRFHKSMKRPVCRFRAKVPVISPCSAMHCPFRKRPAGFGAFTTRLRICIIIRMARYTMEDAIATLRALTAPRRGRQQITGESSEEEQHSGERSEPEQGKQGDDGITPSATKKWSDET